MPNYELKQQVLLLGIDKVQRKISKDIWYNNTDIDKVKQYYDIWYEKMMFYGSELWLEAKRVNGARYARNTRLWKRIYSMLCKGQCIFLTLTFTDYDLSHSTFDDRRRWVRRYLKSQSDYYIANIDFGEKNGREHYHAVILADKVSYSEWNSKHGNINGKIIHCGVEDAKRLSKYVSKLTNHAIKDTAKSFRVIYGKNIHLL